MKRMHTKEFIESLIEQLDGGKIKTGIFITDEDGNFVHVDETPEDYGGPAITIGDDGYIYIENWSNGGITTSIEISPNGIEFVQNDGEEEQLVDYNIDGATKVSPIAITHLTHSFSELDETLRDIIDRAIDYEGETGVACTPAQWNTIKQLLDNSLFINFDNVSMIKTNTNGIDFYGFGGKDESPTTMGGHSLTISYDNESNLLFAVYGNV